MNVHISVHIWLRFAKKHLESGSSISELGSLVVIAVNGFGVMLGWVEEV